MWHNMAATRWSGGNANGTSGNRKEYTEAQTWRNTQTGVEHSPIESPLLLLFEHRVCTLCTAAPTLHHGKVGSWHTTR